MGPGGVGCGGVGEVVGGGLCGRGGVGVLVWGGVVVRSGPVPSQGPVVRGGRGRLVDVRELMGDCVVGSRGRVVGCWFWVVECWF